MISFVRKAKRSFLYLFCNMYKLFFCFVLFLKCFKTFHRVYLPPYGYMNLCIPAPVLFLMLTRYFRKDQARENIKCFLFRILNILNETLTFPNITFFFLFFLFRIIIISVFPLSCSYYSAMKLSVNFPASFYNKTL